MIVNVMKEYILDIEIFISGCGTLFNITENNGKRIIIFPHTYHCLIVQKQPENNKTKAGQAGAIEAIVSAMKAHVENADACHSGFNALLNITFNDSKIQQTSELISCLIFHKTTR